MGLGVIDLGISLARCCERLPYLCALTPQDAEIRQVAVTLSPES